MSEQPATPRVSVVIPSYNRRDEMVATVRSLSEQSFKEFEIVVVDDGSSDGTCDIDLGAIDPRARLIALGSNQGGSAARNAGADAAVAPLVAFLDSDDRWVPNKLARQLSQVDTLGLIGTDFLMTSNVTKRFRGEDTPHNVRAPAPSERIDHYLLKHGQALQTSTMLLPTALARRVRFRDGLRRHQDWDFAIRIIDSGARLIYSAEELAIYNLEPDPYRVSGQKGKLGATVEWFRLSEGLVSRDAMQAYFLRSALGRVILAEPGAVAGGAAWLATRSPVALPMLLAGAARQAVARLRGHG